jgi:hypothetical protein
MFLYSSTGIPGLSTDVFPMLNLIYCVPEFVYENFKTNPVDPKSDAKEIASENAAAACRGEASGISENVSEVYSMNLLKVLSSDLHNL